MLLTLPIAAGGLEGLIWLIIALFWVVAQLIARGRQSGSPKPRPRPEPSKRRAPPLEQEMREFLERVGGKEEQEQPRTPPPPPTRRETAPPEERPPRSPPRTLGEHASAKHEDAQRRMRERQRAVAAALQESAGAELPEIKARPQWGMETPGDTTHPIVTTKSFLVKLGSLRMPLTRVPLLTSYQSHPSATAPRLRDNASIRRAMLHHFLLGPPKAFEEDSLHRF